MQLNLDRELVSHLGFMPQGASQKRVHGRNHKPLGGTLAVCWLVVLRITDSFRVSGFRLSFIWPQ